MNLEEMIGEWKIDCVLNESDVLGELFKSPLLHAKYLERYIFFKAKLSNAEKKYNKMTYLRKRYYRGEMTREELVANGWDQYTGLKMQTTEFNKQIDIDPVLVDIKEVVDSHKTSVSTAEYIMKAIAGREWLLKSAIDFRKFIGGN